MKSAAVMGSSQASHATSPTPVLTGKYVSPLKELKKLEHLSERKRSLPSDIDDQQFLNSAFYVPSLRSKFEEAAKVDKVEAKALIKFNHHRVSNQRRQAMENFLTGKQDQRLLRKQDMKSSVPRHQSVMDHYPRQNQIRTLLYELVDQSRPPGVGMSYQNALQRQQRSHA